MVWSISVDMSNEALKQEVLNAFSGASEKKSLLDRFTMYEWPDVVGAVTFTTKGSESANFADYDAIDKITKKYPSIISI